MPSRLETNLCGVALRNPILAASGTFGYAIEFAKLVDLNRLGGIVTKGLSREPIAGNPGPRLWQTGGGMINSVGLQNVGVTRFISEKLPKLRAYSVPILANVFGYCDDDYLAVVHQLEQASGIAGYELNVSCPNTSHGGMFYSSDAGLLAELIARVRPLTRRPLIVKLSPNVAKIEPLAKAAEDSGADALSLVNTFVSLAIDVTTRTPKIGAGFGGLSGPAIKPIALRMVYEASRAVKIPIIGLGGISTGEDAAEFLIAGASAVEVGTANFWDPRAPLRIANELDKVLRREHLSNVKELTGSLQLPKR